MRCRFCNACGQPLAGAASSGALVAYTPKHLAEKILTSKAALEGEREHVTVLFADMKGSTELLADRDPEETRTLLCALRAIRSLSSCFTSRFVAATLRSH